MAGASRLSRAILPLLRHQAGLSSSSSSSSSKKAVPGAWGLEGSWIARHLHSSQVGTSKMAGAPIPLTTGR